MSHSIRYNPQERIIEIKIVGDLTLNEAREMIAEAAPIAQAENCYLVLNDMREARLRLSILDLYELPKTIFDMLITLGVATQKLRRAIVISKDVKDFLFFETVNLNRGLTTRLFRDMQEARKWLAENNAH